MQGKRNYLSEKKKSISMEIVWRDLNDKLNDICWIGYLELNMISHEKRDGIKVMQLPKSLVGNRRLQHIKWDLNACFQDTKDKQTLDLWHPNIIFHHWENRGHKREGKRILKCCGTNWLCYILAILISSPGSVQVDEPWAAEDPTELAVPSWIVEGNIHLRKVLRHRFQIIVQR